MNIRNDLLRLYQVYLNCNAKFHLSMPSQSILISLINTANLETAGGSLKIRDSISERSSSYARDSLAIPEIEEYDTSDRGSF